MCHSSRSSTAVTPRPEYFRSSGSVVDLVGRVEAAAGVLRDSLQQRRVHRRVEVLGVVGHRADVRHAGADALALAGRFELRLVPAGFAGARSWRGTGRCARRSTASARRPSCPTATSRCATTLASFSSTNRAIDDVGRQRDRLPRLDAIGQRAASRRRRARRPRASAAAAARSSRGSDPRRASSRPSASATSPAPETRSTCRGRSARRRGRRARGGVRRSPDSSAVAPGLIASIVFTVVSGGIDFQRSADACSVSPSCVTACACPARVGLDLQLRERAAGAAEQRPA